MNKLFWVLSVLVWCSAAVIADTVAGRVIKYPLNVRAGAGMKYTAVAQLAKHNPVEITAVNAKWLAIKPPENSLVWVQARFIKNGKLVSNVNLRSGPSTGYEPLGTGRRGQKVIQHGKPTAAGWVAIKAPENIVFYVGRPAVEVDEKALAKLPKFNAPGGRPLPNDDLIQLEGNFTSAGKNVRLSGYIYEEKLDGIKAISHILYEAKGEELLPKYFIMPNRKKLDKFNGKKVTVIGESYTVKNWKLPVVVLKIIRSAE